MRVTHMVGLRRRAYTAATLALLASGALEPITGQAEVHPLDTAYFRPGISLTYFPLYVSEAPWTQRWGIDLSGRMGNKMGDRLELGYTYVPQVRASSNAAPRLHALRAMLVGSLPEKDGSSTVTLTGGVGVAALLVRAQSIDCVTSPVCGEWAAQSGTRFAAVGGIGVAVPVSRRFAALLDVHVFRPFGEEWSAGGDPELMMKIGAGIGIRPGS